MAKLGEENVTPLFNVYQKDIVKRNKGVRFELNDLKKYSETYQELIDCSPNSEIRRSMLFFDTFDITTVHPFILFVINELEVSSSYLSKILHILESYTVRRLLCLKTQSTKNYTKLFSRLIRELKGKSFHLTDFADLLSEEKTNSTRFPNNFDVENFLMIQRAAEVKENVLRYILFRIELMKRKKNQFFEKNELVFDKSLTLEHIMPQKWHTKWHLPIIEIDEKVDSFDVEKTVMYEDMFSAEYKKENNLYSTYSLEDGLIDKSFEPTLDLAQKRNTFLHCIGNLTLVTGRLNPSLSNDIFRNKREKLYKNSLLVLNREVCERQTWDTSEIRERGEEMLKLFFKICPSLEHFSDGAT